MALDRNLLAHCGLYCGTCAVLMAHRDGNRKFKELLAPLYGVTADDLVCEGCRSDVRPVFCQTCTYRDCVHEKGIDGCHQCNEWPCKMIEDFPIEVGKRVIMRTIPAWRELGDERFGEEEEKRYLCPNCGLMLFRGAKRCRQCKEPVNLD